MPIVFSNNATSTLASGISDSDVTAIVAATEGARFPSLNAGDYFIATIEDGAGNREIVKCTARSGDSLTIERAQEGTAAQAFTSGATIEIRLTAGTLAAFVQAGSAGIQGDFTFTGQVSANTLEVGTAGVIDQDAADRMAIDGRAILTAPVVDADPQRWQFQPGMIVLWSGAVGDIPAGWHLCDGTTGIVGEDGTTYNTPDLTDRFVLGAGGGYAVDATGGSLSPTTSTNGAHSHGGATAYHTLSISEIPTHRHNTNDQYRSVSGPIRVRQGSNDGFDVLNILTVGNLTTQTLLSDQTGGSQAHRHGISSDGNHNHSVGLPAYYALAYIMKIG